MELTTVYGEPSWQIRSDKVNAYLTRTGGHLGPVTFDLDGQHIQPYNVAPWHDEPDAADLEPILRVLRGDFFCMPFGANETPFRGESHPTHGEVCNAEWTLEDHVTEGPEIRLMATLDTSIRRGSVRKTVSLREGESVVYQCHRITGLDGPMSYGHHAMLRFPAEEGSGRISTSPFVLGATAPVPLELPENRGYSMLSADRRFGYLSAVPTIAGYETDLSWYPARKGFEDLVMLVSAPRTDFAWSAVSFPDSGYVWFALKNPSVLTNTVLWLSNRGRYYPPWNGRHENVLGIEEVTSYFHYGLSESVAPNPISEAGHKTVHQFEPDEPFEVRYIMGVVACPATFGRVDEIEPLGDSEIAIRDESGLTVTTPVQWSFVAT
jgi:hypothetical protein